MSSPSTAGFWLYTAAPEVCVTRRFWSPLWPARASTMLMLRSDAVDLAAIYCAGIVRNHPFVDGNKRTGFVVGVLFLELNGFRFTASEEDAAQTVLALAAGTLDEASYGAWLRTNVKRKRAR